MFEIHNNSQKKDGDNAMRNNKPHNANTSWFCVNTVVQAPRYRGQFLSSYSRHKCTCIQSLAPQERHRAAMPSLQGSISCERAWSARDATARLRCLLHVMKMMPARSTIMQLA